MKYLLLIFVLLSSCKHSSEKEFINETYMKIHNESIVIDTHNDILMKALDKGIMFDQDLTGKAHSDLDRWKKGGLDVQIFSVFSDGGIKNPYLIANMQMNILDSVVARNPNKIVKVFNKNEIFQTVKENKIALNPLKWQDI